MIQQDFDLELTQIRYGTDGQAARSVDVLAHLLIGHVQAAVADGRHDDARDLAHLHDLATAAAGRIRSGGGAAVDPCDPANW